jgi:23S rRNA (uracil1939-C5)-methyltransferase
VASPPERVACPHAEACPGCPTIDLSAAARLDAKAGRLARALAVFPWLGDPAPEPVRPAPTLTEYRTRAKLVVGPGPRVGLYARGGHEILDLPGCRVLAPVVAAGAAALRRLLADPPPDAEPTLRPEGDGPGRLRAVDLREVHDEEGTGLVVTLVVRVPPAPDPAALDAAAAHLARLLPTLRGVAVSLHDGRSPQLLGAPPRVVRGPELYRDETAPGAPWVWVAPGSFAQPHRAQAAAIRDEVAAVLGAGSPSGRLVGLRVLDLYAGSGALALALAAAGARVTGVESFVPAAEAATRAAEAQGLTGVAVHGEPVEAALQRLATEAVRFDAAVANPPRRGLAPRAREALAARVDHTIVYVSCEPETLSRDLAHLAWLGWPAARLAPFDLMPLTAEVETLAVLRRGAPPPLALLFEDEALLAVDKPPFLPTVPHPEHAGSLLARVRELRGAARAAPVHRLDAGTSGVCLFAKSGAAAAALQRALADPATSREYLALVRGLARPRGRIARPLAEAGRLRSAATRYRRLDVAGGHALLAVRLETGRTHQIRRHLAALGEPVLGDARHGHPASNRHAFERFGLDRPFLHCARVALPHRGRVLHVEAPLAPDLAAVLRRLGGDPAPYRPSAPIGAPAREALR